MQPGLAKQRFCCHVAIPRWPAGFHAAWIGNLKANSTLHPLPHLVHALFGGVILLIGAPCEGGQPLQEAAPFKVLGRIVWEKAHLLKGSR